jgi:phage portal protein BeeE
VAVLGEGLKYEPMAMTSRDSQLIEQLKFTAEMVCVAFRVPPHKISVGPPPNYNNIQALDIQYYAQCLQEKVEKVEELLDDALGLGPRFGNNYGTEFDLDDLARMDTSTLIASEKEAAGIKKLNESRKRLNLPPVDGGDTVYKQEQDHSVEWLALRDEQPPTSPTPPPSPEPSPEIQDEEKALTGDDVRGRLMTRLLPLAVKHAEAQHVD